MSSDRWLTPRHILMRVWPCLYIEAYICLLYAILTTQVPSPPPTEYTTSFTFFPTFTGKFVALKLAFVLSLFPSPLSPSCFTFGETFFWRTRPHFVETGLDWRAEQTNRRCGSALVGIGWSFSRSVLLPWSVDVAYSWKGVTNTLCLVFVFSFSNWLQDNFLWCPHSRLKICTCINNCDNFGSLCLGATLYHVGRHKVEKNGVARWCNLKAPVFSVVRRLGSLSKLLSYTFVFEPFKREKDRTQPILLDNQILATFAKGRHKAIEAVSCRHFVFVPQFLLVNHGARVCLLVFRTWTEMKS